MSVYSAPVSNTLFLPVIFNNMNVQGREDHIRLKNLCTNCLAPGHQGRECRSWARCRACGGKHHTLIHKERRSNATVNVITASNTNTESTLPTDPINAAVASTNQPNLIRPINHSLSPSDNLMMTSKVIGKGPGGRQVVARSLLDSGASLTLVSNKIAQSAQLKLEPMIVDLMGTQGVPLKQIRSGTYLNVCPMHQPHLNLSTKSAIVQEVTCDLHLQGAAHVKEMPHLKSLPLTDPTFDSPGRIDMLIGTDLLPQVLLTGLVSGPEGTPTAMQTVFGWAVLGPYPSQTQVNVITTLNSDPVNDILICFWKVEEPPDNPSMYTPCWSPRSPTLLINTCMFAC